MVYVDRNTFKEQKRLFCVLKEKGWKLKNYFQILEQKLEVCNDTEQQKFRIHKKAILITEGEKIQIFSIRKFYEDVV